MKPLRYRFASERSNSWPASARARNRSGCTGGRPGRQFLSAASSLRPERRPVRRRGHADGAVEVPAQGGGGAHAAAGGDLLDGGVGAFEELLGAGDALLVQPVERPGLELGVHPAGELPGAEAGVPGEVAHRQRLVEAGPRPLERGREPVGAARLGGRGDELRLPAAAVGGHDQSPRDPVGGRGAEVATHEVDAEVERRRLARRGEHVALVDVEHVGAHVDLRVAAGQVVGVHPVRGRDAAVEQPGRRQHEGAGAQRRDPHAAPVRRAQRLDELRVRVPRRGRRSTARRRSRRGRSRRTTRSAGSAARGARAPSAVQTTRSYHSPLGERSERSTPKISEAIAAS